VRRGRSAVVGLSVLLHGGVHGDRVAPAARFAAPDTVVTANDNRVPAGRRVAGALVVSLELREALWMPAGPTGRASRVFAFAEPGKLPSIPGPLIRVAAGTEVRVTLHNALDRRAIVQGLHDHDGRADSVVLTAGESRDVSFRAVSPGTHFYWASTRARVRPLGRYEDSQLVGAFIVDSAASSAGTNERVMVLSAFTDTVRDGHYPDSSYSAYAINGRSWPQTERLSFVRGDTVRWRVINASDHFHPMHLHGFFFTVNSRGSARRDTIYAAANRREEVTTAMRGASTISLTWIASRTGNWLFHCHTIAHIETALRSDKGALAAAGEMSHAHVEDVMSGLVMALSVRDPRGSVPSPRPRAANGAALRTLRLFVTERPAIGGASAEYSYVLQHGPQRPASDSAPRPGSTIVLRQGEPTAIVVTNLARHATAVHWHGLELESYYDGVAGWSGAMTRMAPLIAPGDSFAVRITPPRAGTFIYHTHADEKNQLRGGLFGAFIVLPAGVSERDTTERLVVISQDGPELPDRLAGARRDQPAIALSAGVAHRLRLVNIPTDAVMQVRLLSDTTVTTWRPVAKDGADLPAAQAVTALAFVIFGAGETLDVELHRERPEVLTLEIKDLGSTRPPWRIAVTVH
jgi:FtsP/CotA-like multicopper oxidase with cupredoxin domain